MPGTLGRFLVQIGQAGGDVGEIKMIYQGTTQTLRDIVFFADDLAHVDRLIAVAQATPDVELLEIRDDVLDMHQGGKIAIRSRYTIDRIEVLQRVYTPGVAEVCLKIKNEPAPNRRRPARSYPAPWTKPSIAAWPRP